MFGLSTHRLSHRTICKRQHRHCHIGLHLAAIFLIVPFLVTLAGAPTSYAAPNDLSWPPIRLQSFANGFQSPLDVESAHDGTGRLFVLEQGGLIYILDHGARLTTPFLDISAKVATCDECGVLGLAFPADFASKGYFFVDYTSNVNLVPGDTGDPDGITDEVVARYHLSSNPNRADPKSEKRILIFNKPAANHNGGHILFGPDGYLYLGTGDGGGGGDTYKNGQDHGSLLGKILRLEVGETGTYSIPATNPFTTTAGFRPEIWAFGLRNPWRYGFDRSTGDLYIGDVGQNLIEEVDHIAAAKIGNGGFNFGWNIMEGDQCFPPEGDQSCSRKDITLPVATYQHVDRNCSITGGFVYHSSLPFQAPIYLYADYCSGKVWGLQADGNQFVSLELSHFNGNITSFGEDEDGTIYLVGQDGEILKIVDFTNSIYLPGLIKSH